MMDKLEIPQPQRVLDEALSRGGDYAEIFAENTSVLSLALQDRVVSQAQQSLLHGAGIRTIKGMASGYAYTMDLSFPALLSSARFAATVGGMAHGHCTAPSFASAQMPLLGQSEETEQVRQRLLALDECVRQMDARVEKVKAAITIRNQQILFLNSEGQHYTDHRPCLSVYLRVVMTHEGQSQMGFASKAIQGGLAHFAKEDFDELARTAVSRAAFLFDAIQPKGGEMPVVMAPGGSGILLHEAIGHAFEADFNMAGTSIFSNRLGQRVCRPEITIVDDGTRAGEVSCLKYDDEGTPGQRTVLVEGGILSSYMHDRISAHHYGVQPTGNGRRESFRHVPQPRMRSTLMCAGEASAMDIIRSVKHGVYAMVFTNGQVQIGAGDFTFYMKQGYLIEDGHLTQPIRDVNITGNGPQALADISMVGNDLLMDNSAAICGKGGQSVPVGQGLPTVRVDKLIVG